MANPMANAGAAAAASPTTPMYGEYSSVLSQLMSYPADTRRALLFGQPVNGPVDTTQPSDRYSSDFRTDPFIRAYGTQNKHIRSIIIRSIEEKDVFMTREILPMRPPPEDREIMFSTLEFHDVDLPEVPETGTVRLTTSSFRSWKIGMHRRGRGFMMEDGFAVTALGIISYFASIVQITTAAVEALVLNGYRALLNTMSRGAEDADYEQEIGIANKTLFEQGQERTEMWAATQKGPNGFRQVTAQAGLDLAKRGVAMDSCITPQGARGLMDLQFNGQAPTSPGVIGESGNVKFYESTQYTFNKDDGTGSTKSDPMVRASFIGESNSFQPHLILNQYPNRLNYESRHYTVHLFDCDRDCFTPIQLADMFESSGLFEEGADGAMTDFGMSFFAACGGNTLAHYLASLKGTWLKDVAAAVKNHSTKPADSGAAAKLFTGSHRTGPQRAASTDDDDDDVYGGMSDRKSSGVYRQRFQVYDTPPQRPADWAPLVEKAQTELNETKQPQLMSIFKSDMDMRLDKASVGAIVDYYRSRRLSPALRTLLQAMYSTRSQQVALYAQAGNDAVDIATAREFFVLVFGGTNAKEAVVTGNMHMSRYEKFAGDNDSNQLAERYTHVNSRIPFFVQSMNMFYKSAQPKKATAAQFKAVLAGLDNFLNLHRLSGSNSKDRGLLALQPLQNASDDAKVDAMIYAIATNKDAMAALNGDENLISALENAIGNQVNDTSTAADFNYLEQIPLTKKTFLRMIEQNIPFPMGFRFSRPFEEWETGTFLYMKRGENTGITVFGDADLQIGNDVYRKVLHGNFTCRTGSAVFKRKNVLPIPDMMVFRYKTGGGTKMFKPTQQNIIDFQSGEAHGCSMFRIPLYPNEPINHKFTDLTGRFPQSANHKDKTPHFAMCDAFKMLWGFTHPSPYFPSTSKEPSPAETVNTFLPQGAMYYPEITANTYKERGCLVRPTGHWTMEQTFDGCMANRCGKNGGLPGQVLVKAVVAGF